MLGILSIFRPKRYSKAPHSFRPQVEEMEERRCPTANLTLAAVVQSGHQVQLSGTLTGDEVAGMRIMFGGANWGTAWTDSSGNFSYTSTDATLGSVSATAVSVTNGPIATAYATLAVSAPALSLSLSHGTQDTVTLSGSLTGYEMAGRTITFSGALSATTTADSSGNFTLTTTTANLGYITAHATDIWGQGSNTPEVVVASDVPAICSFTATHGVGQAWTFQGRVADDNPEGLTVAFGGLMSLYGQTATVQSDGWFYLTLNLTSWDTGTASAITEDWWGQDSNTAYFAMV